MKQYTEFDGRVVGARHICRMATPAIPVNQCLIFAVSGGREIVAYDAFRRLEECPGTGDLGASPGAVVWVEGMGVWTVLSDGHLQLVEVEDADHLSLGVNKDAQAATNNWLCYVRLTDIEATRINNQNRPLVNDADELRATTTDLSALICPGPLGSMILYLTDGSLVVEADRISSVMSDIVDAVQYTDGDGVQWIYAVSSTGEIAVVEVQATGLLQHRNRLHLENVVGPLRLLVKDDTLYITVEQRNRVRIFDLTDPEVPAFIEERSYGEVMLPRAVAVLDNEATAVDPETATLFDIAGDDLIERSNYAVTFGIEDDIPDGAPTPGRVRAYLHAKDGAVTISNPFVPAPMVGSLTTVGRSIHGSNSIGASDRPANFPVNSPGSWRYLTTSQNTLQAVSYTIPGDPNVTYDIRVRVRGCTENSRFACSVSTFTATGGQTVFTTSIADATVTVPATAQLHTKAKVRVVTAAQVAALGVERAFREAAYLSSGFTTSASGGMIRVTLTTPLAAGDMVRISLGSDITAPPYNQPAHRPGIRAGDAPKIDGSSIDTAYLSVEVNAVETIRFQIGTRVDGNEITNALNHTAQLHDAANSTLAAEFGMPVGTNPRFCQPPFNTYHTMLDDFIDLRVPGQAVIKAAQVTSDVFSSWPVPPDGIIDPPVGVQNNYNPPNTTGPYTFGPFTPPTAQPESELVIPPDDDPEFPLCVPWKPRFPNAAFPWGQFLQVDIVRSIRATGT